MKRRLGIGLAGLWLTACTTPLPIAPISSREAIIDFSLEARFALKVNLPQQAPQSSGGRLSWVHRNTDNQVLVSSPLGYGIAEIRTTPAISTLRTADGKTRESTDPDALMEAVTGQRLPVTRLPAWLLGRSGTNATIEQDALGRPARLHEAGWAIEYDYESESPGALPVRVTLHRDNEIELRLRIEEWKEQP